MTRRKSHRRFRQKKNKTVSDKNNKLPLIPNSPDTEKENCLINSAGRTPVKTPNNLICESKIENCQNQQTPDGLFRTPLKMEDLDNLFSPTFCAIRVPKLKLDFTTPENVSDQEDFVIDSSKTELISKRLPEQFDNLLQLETVENRVNEQITIVMNDKSKTDPTIKMSECESGYDSNSPTNKQISTSFDEKKNETGKYNSVMKTEIDDKQIPSSIKSETEFSIIPETIVTLPQKKYYNNTLTLKSHCILFRQSMLMFRKLILPFPKVIAVFSWISSKIGGFMKQIFTQVPKILISQFISQSNSAPIGKKDCNQILSAIRCENEKTLTILSVQVTNFSEELNQVRTTSEISIRNLTREVTSLREANEKLVENSCVLVEELKSLHETLKTMESTSKNSLQVLPQAIIPPTPSLPSPFFVPPPPPPPFPPSPFLTQNEKTPKAPKTPRTPTTPKSIRKFKQRTPAKRSSSTSSNRPSITVEDLLKVTLKKAPNSSKENTRRSSFPVQKGPAISLDMLRSVKLRSSRSKPSDQTIKSPRNRSAILNNRSNSNSKLSPSSARSDNPLDRILMQVDLNRPQRRKPTQREID